MTRLLSLAREQGIQAFEPVNASLPAALQRSDTARALPDEPGDRPVGVVAHRVAPALGVRGQLQCEHGREWLESYDKELQRTGVAGLREIVLPLPEVNPAAIDKLRTSVQNALKSFP